MATSRPRGRFGRGRIPIGARILALSSSLLLIMAIILLVVVKHTVDQTVYDQILSEVQHSQDTLWYLARARGEPHLVDGSLVLGNWRVEGDHSVVDDVKKISGGDATIFQLMPDGKVIRLTTTVLKANGERNDHTELVGPARAAFDRGESFTGISPVAGRDFINRYDPLKDSTGKIVGVLYTGVPLTMMAAAEAQVMQAVVAAGIGVLIVGLALLLVLVVRPLSRGLRQATAAATGLARGELDQSLDIRSNDELGDLANAFRTMIAYQTEMASVAGAVATGDLRRQVVPVSGRDVFGRAFAEMIASLREVVGRVQASATTVAESSQQLGSAANQTRAAVWQVNDAIQHVTVGAQGTSRAAQDTNTAVEQLTQAVDGIARGATEQARQIQAASATASQMAAGVERVAANAEHVSTASEQARQAAVQGGQAVQETTTMMAEIQTVVGQAAGTVQELGKLGEKIGQVIETIDDIAEQTNLLALNAAIEAARAGEHGKGFAVVADEVRKLAERSQRETKAIAELIQQVQAGTRQAVGAMDRGAARVELGSEKADQAGRALNEILQAVEATVRQVSDIAVSSREMALGARSVTEAMESISAVVEENTASTEEMAAQSNEVSNAIASIAAASEEQSAATEEVSASAEEMSSQVEEISAQAQELAATAELLKELVARFQCDQQRDTLTVLDTPEPEPITLPRAA